MNNIFTNLLNKIKGWWQVNVIEPKRKAAIKREKTIMEAPEAIERSIAKLSAVAEAEPGAEPEEIAKKAAERYRKIQADADELKRLVEFYQASPKPVKAAVEKVAGTHKTPAQKLGGYLKTGFAHVFDRLRSVIAAAMKEQRQLEKEGIKIPSIYSRDIDKMNPEDIKKLEEAGERLWKTVKYAAVHPEKYTDEVVVPPEEFPESWPSWLRKTSSFATDVGVGLLTDPLEVFSVGARAVPAATRLAKSAKAVAKTVGKPGDLFSALKQQEVADRINTLIRKLNVRKSNTENLLKTAKSVVDDLAKDAKKAEKFVKSTYKKQSNKLNKAIEKYAKSASASVEDAEKLAKLKAGKATLDNRLRNALNTVKSYEREQQKLDNLRKQLDYANKSLDRLYDMLEKYERGARSYVYKVGPATIKLDKLGSAVGSAYRKAVSETPVVRDVANALVKAFKTTTPLYSKELSAKEAKKLSDVMQILAERVRRASTESMSEALKHAEDLAKRKIPTEVWEKASIAAEKEVFGDPAEYAEFMSKMPEEMREMVQKARSIWEKSEAGQRKLLEKVFGQEMIGFFGMTPNDVEQGWRFFLNGFVPHIVTDPPSKVRSVLEKNWHKIAQAVPGARPSFTKSRIIPTIEVLEKIGLHPIKDLRVLDAAHKYQVERLVMLKDITDWLSHKGFILPANAKAAKGWEKASGLFPWLRDKTMHPEIARVFKDLMPIFDVKSDVVKTFLKPLGKINTMFKTLATAVRLPFHLYNASGNLVLGKLAGIHPSEMAVRMGRAVKMFIEPTGKEKEIVELFRRYGLEGQGVFADLVVAQEKTAKQIHRYVDKLTGGKLGKIKAVVFPRYSSKLAAPAHVGRWFGEMVDSTARMAAFTHFLDKGYSPMEAARLVKRYFFDYGNLTAVERQVFRNIVPFYSWIRYAIPRAILGTAENPTALGMLMRIKNTAANLAGVDQSELPVWLQDAVILGTDEDGKYLYIRTGSPYETLIQIFGEVPEKGASALLEAVAGNVTPLYPAFSILTTGVDPTTGRKIPEDLTEENIGLERLKAAVSRLLPTWEIEQSLAVPYRGTAPRTTTRAFPGLLGMAVPIQKYDYPYAKAKEITRAENVINEYKAKMAEEQGIDIPETVSIMAETTKLDRAAKASEVFRSLRTDSKKLLIIYTLSGGNVLRAWNMIQQRPDMFMGTATDVAKNLLTLFTPENTDALKTYLGRDPKLHDFITYADRLRKKELPETTPDTRRLQNIISDVEYMQRAEETGGLAAVPKPPEDIDAVIRKAAEITKVPKSWLPYLRWLAWAESRFNPNAYNNKPASNDEHAHGLFQMLPSTFKENAVQGMEDIFNPLDNAVAAIRYIKRRYKHPSKIPDIGNKDAYRGY